MHRVLLYICLLCLVTIVTGCVERYYPEDSDMKTGTLVINAHLTDQPGVQVIEISRSVDLTEPSFDPVSGSFAEVIREDGEFREFSEFKPGYYKADLDDSFLQTGDSYMIHVITPDGNEYESVFDKLRPVPEIDSLYYQVEHNSFASEEDSTSGVRFYIDFTYDDEAYEYIRWDLTETYEFHNPDMEGFILDVDFRLKELSDTSNYRVCYITNELSSIHSMSLYYLDFGIYIKKPFTFVPNIQQEQKLHHKYSLLVKQYSLGEEAFHYWNELKKTSQEQGFLFDRQPALLKSNIHNVNDDSEIVLGFFSMASVEVKRAFAVNPEGLDRSAYKWYCFPVSRGPGGFLTKEDLPMYFARAWMGGVSSYAEVNKHCVDCRAYKNSSHIMPDFW
ncbi:MAG: hypothetical protein DRJ13_04300 [Bacteroidetes bacterium]|nr:MAG: hypothetical protein DRJ13_04300 [Bacteroidota bacterium]